MLSDVTYASSSYPVPGSPERVRPLKRWKMRTAIVSVRDGGIFRTDDMKDQPVRDSALVGSFCQWFETG